MVIAIFGAIALIVARHFGQVRLGEVGLAGTILRQQLAEGMLGLWFRYHFVSC